MQNPNPVIASIDCGSSMIRVIIAEVTPTSEIRVVGYGQAKSEGIKDGVISNIDRAAENIRKAVKTAEQMADVAITHAYISIAGEHIRTKVTDGIVAVSRPPHDATGREIPIIRTEDVRRVLENAKNQIKMYDSEILHIIPQEFSVDREIHITQSPVGRAGLKLEAKVFIITASSNAITNLLNVFRKLGIQPIELVYSPLAASYALLSSDDKELGVVLIDIGGGTTDVAIFFEGSIRYTDSIRWGGGSITADVARELSIPSDTAEQLKIERGSVYPPINNKQPFFIMQRDKRQRVDPDFLNRIIFARANEILEDLVLRRIKKAGVADYIASGTILAGGGANLRDIDSLSGEIFDKYATIGSPKGLSGLTNGLTNPEWSTCVGLMLYGVESELGSEYPEQTMDKRQVGSEPINLFKLWKQLVTKLKEY